MVRDSKITNIAYILSILGLTTAVLLFLSGLYIHSLRSKAVECPPVDPTPAPCIPASSSSTGGSKEKKISTAGQYVHLPKHDEGHELTGSCCYYSHPDAPALIQQLIDFEQDYINTNFALLRYNSYVDTNMGINPFFRYGKHSSANAGIRTFDEFNRRLVDMETPLANNSDLQYLYTLRTETQRVRSETNNTMERVMYDRYLAYMTLILELAEVDALFLIYGLRDHGSGVLDNPINTIMNFFRSNLPRAIPPMTNVTETSEIYTNWLAAVDAKITRFHEHGIRSMAAQHVHSERVLSDTWQLSYGPTVEYHPWGDPVSSPLYGYNYIYSTHPMEWDVCSVLLSTAMVSEESPGFNTSSFSTLCLDLYDSVVDKLDNLSTWWETEYMVAAATLRPDYDQNLASIPDGQAIYNAFRKFHLGTISTTDAQFFTELALDPDAPDHWSNDPRIYPNSRLFWEYEIPDVYRVRAEVGGVSDSMLHQCSSVVDDIERPYKQNLTAIRRMVSPLMGISSRSYDLIQVQYSPSGASHQVETGIKTGLYQNWFRPNYYTIHGEFACLGFNNEFAFKEGPFQVADLARYLYPGMAMRDAIDSEIDCKFGTKPLPGRPAFVQGYGHYAVDICGDAGCFDSSDIQLIGHGHSLAELKLLAHFDICMNTLLPGVTPCTTSDLWDAHEDYGVRNNRYDIVLHRIANTPGYYLSAYYGYKRIHELRTSFMNSLNAISSPVRPHSGIATFHNALLRFGMTDVDNELQPMFTTLLKFYNNQTITTADYAWDLIPSQFFSTKTPTVGYGRNPSDLLCPKVPDTLTGAIMYTTDYIKP